SIEFEDFFHSRFAPRSREVIPRSSVGRLLHLNISQSSAYCSDRSFVSQNRQLERWHHRCHKLTRRYNETEVRPRVSNRVGREPDVAVLNQRREDEDTDMVNIGSALAGTSPANSER